ncbi:MAG: hypothetical protein RIM99_02295 [Cyclobacteriaceae bacterium]
MTKIISIAMICLVAGFKVQSQVSDNSDFQGSYLGLQGNELLRQLLNFGDAGIPDNPYFFNYTYVSSTGDGLNVGFALSADEFNQLNGFNNVETEIENFSFRVGYGKRKEINKRFYYSLGVDLLIDSFKNTTTTEDTFGGGIFRIESTTSGWGMGPRFTLNYKITDGLIIGTESNYYYKRQTEKFESSTTNGSNGIEEESKIKLFRFAAPSVLWISIRL